MTVTRTERIEQMTGLLVKLAEDHGLQHDPEFGAALLMMAAGALEKRVEKDGFLEMARAWWNLVRDGRDMVLPEPMMLPELEQQAREVATLVSCAVPSGTGFALVVFDWLKGSDDKPGHLTYLGTGERNDIIRMLDSLLTHLRGKREHTKTGKRRS